MASDFKKFKKIRTRLDALESYMREEVGPSELSVDQQLELAKDSYEGIAAFRDHLLDLAARILTAIAFFTAAAAAIYRESHDTLKGKPIVIWPELFFGTYLVFVVSGALFLLGAMWPPVWSEKGPGQDCHSITNFSKVKERITDTEIASPEYRKSLLSAFVGAQRWVARDGRIVADFFRWGGACLTLAFFALIALAATLFFSENTILPYPNVAPTTPLKVGLTAVVLTLWVGTFIRHERNWTYLFQFNFKRGQFYFWPKLWTVVLLAVLFAVLFIDFKC